MEVSSRIVIVRDAGTLYGNLRFRTSERLADGNQWVTQHSEQMQDNEGRLKLRRRFGAGRYTREPHLVSEMLDCTDDVHPTVIGTSFGGGRHFLP